VGDKRAQGADLEGCGARDIYGASDGDPVEEDGRDAVENAQLESAGVHRKFGVPRGNAGCAADDFAIE
jgi:hypothetical protein